MSIVLKDEYQRLNETVREGKRAWIAMASALIEIRDRKLYRQAGYETFDDYCIEEHEFKSNYARRLMSGCDIAKKYDLDNEGQARALGRVPEQDQDEVMARVRDRQGQQISSSMIEDMHTEIVQERANTVPPQDAAVLDPVEGEVVEVIEAKPRPAQEAREILSQIESVHAEIKRLAATQSGAFIVLDAVATDLRNVYTHINRTQPTRQCYGCNGRGCKICRDTGFVTEDIYKRRPVEFRGADFQP
tara:strand:+ start:5602 stop:6339 length:738 start_codon:yes stop_codon:yes gene_type:complete